MNKGIYRLFTVTDNTTFYVGRTINATRRLQEHIRHAAAGDEELKYQAIRAFDEANITWDIEIINSDLQAEDFECYKALVNKSPLTNMCKGSVYTEVEYCAVYNSTAEYNNGVERREEAAAAEALLVIKRKQKAIDLASYNKQPKYTNPRFDSAIASTKPPKTTSAGTERLKEIIAKKQRKLEDKKASYNKNGWEKRYSKLFDEDE